MIKLIASDLDGTLVLNGAQKLPEDIFPLIRRLKEMGILFAAASGRQYNNMKRLFAPVVSDMAFICENGAVAFWKDELLYENFFDRNLMMDILKAVEERKDTEFTCSTKDYHYIMPKTEEFRKLLQNEVKVDCKIISSADEITEPCVKMAVYDKEGVTDEALEYWKERFSDRCRVVTSGFAWIDFIPFGTNKANGVKKFQEMLRISPEECVVFGDEYNDIEMLQAVKYSFAMSHSKAGVRAEAHYETDRVQPVLEKLIAANGKMEEVV